MLTYTRKLTAGADGKIRDVYAVVAHVSAELSAMADPNDDPDIRAGDVKVRIMKTDDGSKGLAIVGRLDAEADAPYLKPGYNSLEGVPTELLAHLYNDREVEQQ